MKALMPVFVLLLLACHPLHASDLSQYKQLIKQSLQPLSEAQRLQWAFHLHSQSSQDKTLTETEATFDPTKPQGQRWQLLKTNGEAPDELRQAEFAQTKQAQDAARAAQKDQQQLIDMIQLDTLQVTAQSAGQVTLRFSPNLANMGESSQNKLKGELTLDITNALVTDITIRNIDKLSPSYAVTLETFELGFYFVKIQDTVLPEQLTVKVQGKTGLFKGIRQHSIETYSEYRYKGEPNKP